MIINQYGVMIIDEEFIVLAPLKVASRSLLASFPGKRSYWCKRNLHHAIAHRLSLIGCKKIFFLMRDPVERIFSCWRDKMRVNPRLKLDLPQAERSDPKHRPQYIQRLFLESLSNTADYLSRKESYELLLSSSLSEFIDFLNPSTIRMDAHIAPQIFSLQVKWRFVRLGLRPDYIIPIHDANSLSYFTAKTGFNRDMKKNSTKSFLSKHANHSLNLSQLSKIKSLYCEDYRYLDLAYEQNKEILRSG